MIFVTVGSSLPFDRLVRLIDSAVGDSLVSDSVFAQIGDGHYQPRNFEFVRFLRKSQFDEKVATARAIISHAGIGTIRSALQYSKPLLAMPRAKRFDELVDDHQAIMATRFAELGHILTFSDRTQLVDGLAQLETFRPRARSPNVVGVAAAIGTFLHRATNPRQVTSQG